MDASPATGMALGWLLWTASAFVHQVATTQATVEFPAPLDWTAQSKKQTRLGVNHAQTCVFDAQQDRTVGLLCH
jgi:hypothetical protein